MGVKGLWSLLEPTGRRTDCETLRGKRVAVDASIWLVQFIKAMRDDKGEMLENAHLVGFFRRACRLLHHGVLPVFVFDGATPALKRRTTAVRRRLREESAAKVRKTAEKVLLNALKQEALRRSREANEAAATKDGGFEAFSMDGDGGKALALVESNGGGGAGDDEEWERDWVSEEEYEEEEEEEEEEELDMFVPDGESIDPEVLSALPPSVRLEVIAKMRDKRVADNREHFAAASGKMQEFSALQLETYLKGTKLKRQIDDVMQRSDANDPMMSKRVAALDNREFIFAGPSSLNKANGDRLALPSTSGMDSLKSNAFSPESMFKSRRNRAQTALTAPQEQFLVTNLHPTLPAPSVAKSIAETPIMLTDEPSTLDLQISFSTENIKAAAKDPLFADPTDAAEDDDDDEDEWEDVEDEEPPPARLALAAPVASPEKDVVDLADAQDEEEDAPHGESVPRRKEVYSLSHGFLKGRSLGGWDAEEEETPAEEIKDEEADEANLDAAIALGLHEEERAAAPINADDEDAQLQNAIADSLATGKEKKDDETIVDAMDDDAKDLEAAIEMSLAEDDSTTTMTKKTETKEEEPLADEEEEPTLEEPQLTPVEEATEEEEAWIAAAKEVERRAERDKIEKMLKEAEEEQARLKHEVRQAKQGAEHVTDDMYREVQELLTLFGIPYIIAPQEAEAQCAYLNEHGFVDAVITDDSDVFLFGAKYVYRNFFAEKKYCEVYSTDRIKRELGVDRDRFIQLALLLGSDYTEGINGIGIVNALEIVCAFKGDVLSASKAFREWMDLEELTIVPEHLLPTGSQESPSKKKPEEDPLAAAFKAKHRSLKKSWEVPANYPSQEVIKAYQTPSVDKSEEKFEWGKPDLDMLRLFCIKTFHWSRDSSDQILVPMMKSWAKRDAQRRIDSFFEATHAVGGRVAKFRSARLGAAVANLTNDPESAADLFLQRGPENALDEHIIIDDGDGDLSRAQPREQLASDQPRLDDDDDDELAALDLSQFSDRSPSKPSPSKPSPPAKRQRRAAPARRKK
jgi:5'-3' exonuclease